MALSRDDILARRHGRKEVDVAGVGPVFFRVISLAELLGVVEANKRFTDASEPHKSLAYIVRLTACDEAGAPLFTAGDDATLLEMSMADIKALSDAAMAVNGMTPDADEGARKN